MTNNLNEDDGLDVSPVGIAVGNHSENVRRPTRHDAKRPGVRFVNGIVSAALVCFFFIHAALGCLALSVPLPHTFAFLIWSGVFLIGIHVVLCVSTSRQMLTDDVRPPSARKRRHLVLKWVTGLLLAVAAFIHVIHVTETEVSLGLICQWIIPATTLLLLALLVTHILVGTKSLLKDIGLDRRHRNPLRVGIVTVAALLAAGIVCFAMRC